MSFRWGPRPGSYRVPLICLIFRRSSASSRQAHHMEKIRKDLNCGTKIRSLSVPSFFAASTRLHSLTML